MNLDNQISSFISKVPHNCLFDAHAVIFYLLENYPDDYLGFHSSAERLNAFHGRLSQSIDKLVSENAIERVSENSYSKNIKGNFSENACWKKV